MDEFKKYVRDNAGSLDIDEPRPQVWQNISRETKAVRKPTVVMMVTRWAVAACILALAGIGAWSVFSNREVPHAEIAQNQPKPMDTPTQPDTQQQEPVSEETVAPVTRETPQAKTTTARNDNRAKQQRADNNAMAAAVLRNIETSFTQVINLQRERVSSMPMYAESPEYFNDFKIQIRQMEKDEKVIKSDIAKRGMTDELLDQLINLYQQKLNTLKQLQTEMNKTNNRYKQNHSVVDPSKTYFLNL